MALRGDFLGPRSVNRRTMSSAASARAGARDLAIIRATGRGPLPSDKAVAAYKVSDDSGGSIGLFLVGGGSYQCDCNCEPVGVNDLARRQKKY